MAYEAEERGRWGFGWEMVVEERPCYLSWVRGPWKVQEPLWWATKREPFGCPDGVWSGPSHVTFITLLYKLLLPALFLFFCFNILSAKNIPPLVLHTYVPYLLVIDCWNPIVVRV